MVVANWFAARGAHMVVVPPEQAADLRPSDNKHTKTDRLDSRVLARLPLLHPEGLRTLDTPGPACSLKRAMRQRRSLVKRRTSCYKRLDALVELLGLAWADVLGSGEYCTTALAVLESYADPRRLAGLDRDELADFLRRQSRGRWGEQAADRLQAAADQTLQLWAGGMTAFDELACDIAAEVRTITALTSEIAALDTHTANLYEQADPTGIIASAPEVGTTSATSILGRLGNPDRFANLAGMRSFTGLVPRVDQSSEADAHTEPTKAGDLGLRKALYLAADRTHRVNPTLAATYHRLMVEAGKTHTSAVCHLAAILVTRLTACWRSRQHYVLRDVDGREITEAGRGPLPHPARGASQAAPLPPSNTSNGRAEATRSRPTGPHRHSTRPPPSRLPKERRNGLDSR